MNVRATLIRWFEFLFRHDITPPLEKVHNPRYYGRRMQLCRAAVLEREARKERLDEPSLKPPCTEPIDFHVPAPVRELNHNPRYYGQRLRRVS
jgi:hypothetical protein